MRSEEALVCHALIEFFGGPLIVSGADGEDPPDIYLTFASSRVGVEVTRLSQFTFEQDGTLGNRTTQDSFALRLLEDLDMMIGPSLPDDISFLVSVEVPVLHAARFRKELMDWVAKVADSSVLGVKHERMIDDSKVSISIIPLRPSEKKIVGFVVNKNSSADILLNARLVLEDRIRIKSNLCDPLAKVGPIWLAVLNAYWLADAETYTLASRQLNIMHCFERVFLVSENGVVNELSV